MHDNALTQKLYTEVYHSHPKVCWFFRTKSGYAVDANTQIAIYSYIESSNLVHIAPSQVVTGL